MIKYNHLTEKDLREGQEIADIFYTLDEESKKIILVYAGALRDKQMLDKEKQTA